MFALGGGLFSLRLVWWSVGVAVLVQTYRLAARRFGGDECPHSTAGGLAALLVASSAVFQEVAVQNVAHLAMPALGFTALGLLGRPAGPRPWAAGLVVVAMSLFRLQAVYFVPAAVAYCCFEHGPRSGWRPAAKYAVACAVGLAVVHGGLACAYSGYVENVVRFQMLRPSTDVRGRFAVLHSQMQDWPFVVGVLAAAAAGGVPGRRGVAGYAVAGVAALAAGSRYFAGLYLIAFTPALAALAGDWVARSARDARGVLAAAGVVVLFQAVELYPQVARVTRCAWEWRAVRDVRALPAGTVFVMDQKLAVLAGRRLPADYYATDWYGLSITGGGEEWIGRMVEAADFVVVTERLVNGMTAANVEALVRAGRPVYFPTPAEEQDFQRKFGAKPLRVIPRSAEASVWSR